jgi:hypothetical protein
MSAPYSVATEIQIGQVSSYLAKADAGKQAYYNGTALDSNLHKLIAMETDIVNWEYQNYPSNLTLIQAGWYLYALCGRYSNQALKIIGSGSGGIIIDPTTNRPINLVGVTTMFTVGDSSTSPLMNAGDGGFVINQTGIVFDTVAFGYANSSPMPRTGSVPSGQTTYSVTYTGSSITILLASPFTASDGEQYAITYLRASGGSSFVPAGSGLPAQTGHEGEVLFTDGSTAYWRYPSTKITSASFDQTDGVTCVNTEWAHNSLVIVFDDLPKVLEPGVDYTLISGGGFVITMEEFDARIYQYNLTVWLTGKNTVAS